MLKKSVLAAGAAQGFLTLCAVIASAAAFFIAIFVMARGLPLFLNYPIAQFFTGRLWLPTAEQPLFGIAPFIAGSFLVTVGAMALAAPIGIACAVLMAEISAKSPLLFFLRQAVNLLAGIPSVVYGLVGMAVVAPFVRQTFGGNGFSVLTAALILALMALPTIVSIAETAIRSVPEEYKAGSLALGATRWQTIWNVTLPSAHSGIVAAVALGSGRAIGETMAVLMVAGNAPIMPHSLTSMTRTLTMNVVTEMGYASGDHLTALFACGMVLALFTLALNLLTALWGGKSKEGEK